MHKRFSRYVKTNFRHVISPQIQDVRETFRAHGSEFDN